MIYERRLIPEDLLGVIHNLIDQVEWECGSVSSSVSKTRKINLQAVPGGPRDEIFSHIWKQLDEDFEFGIRVTPSESRSMLLSKTTPGGKYDVHHDSHKLGDYSTTVFLSDPDTYVGGELKVFDGVDVHTFKPAAGTAITYKTGYTHQVCPVESGTRYAIVFWTSTMFRDDNLRRLYSDLMRLQELIPVTPEPSSIESAQDDAYFLLEQICNNMRREFSDR